MALTLYEPVFVVLTRLFPENYRFRITMLTLVGGFASTAFIPLTAWWIEALGWRDALLALAACNLLYCLPVHALMLRDKAGGAVATEASVVAGADSPMRRALRHPVFWGLVVCFTFGSCRRGTASCSRSPSRPGRPAPAGRRGNG